MKIFVISARNIYNKLYIFSKGDKTKKNKIKVKLNENTLSSLVPAISVKGSSDTTSSTRSKKKSTKKIIKSQANL